MTGHIFKQKRQDASHENERVVMKDAESTSSTSEDTSSVRKQRFFQETAHRIFSSTKMQILIVLLVILCSLCLIAQLLIDLRLFELGRDSSRRFSKIFYCISIAILGVFVLESILKLLFLNTLLLEAKVENAFDFCVVALAFSLSLALAGRENSMDGIGLIVMLRLWRFTRILNSIVSTVKKEADRKLTRERRTRRALEREVFKLREYCLQQECEIDTLRCLLRRHAIAEPRRVMRPPSAQRMHVIAEINDAVELQMHEYERKINSA